MGQAPESDSHKAFKRFGEERAEWGYRDGEDGWGEGLERRVQEDVDFRFGRACVTLV